MNSETLTGWHPLIDRPREMILDSTMRDESKAYVRSRRLPIASGQVPPAARFCSVATAAVVCAFMLATAGARAAEWVELGPAPMATGPYTGRCSSLACSPTDRDVIFAGGASGGVWRNTEFVLNWTPLTDDMPTLAIGALAMDPGDEFTIYAGTGEAAYANHSLYGLGIYKTTDRGDTWTQLAEEVFGGRTFSSLLVSHENSNTLYASIMHAGGFPARVAGKGHPGVNGPVGVFRSTDGAETWTHLTNGLPAVAAADVVMDSTDASILYAAIADPFGHEDNGIYKSTDGGDSWFELTSGLPSDSVGRIALAIAPSMPSRLYALYTNPSDQFGGGASAKGIFRTDDGGDTWIEISYAGLSTLQATYGWYISFIVVRPENPDTFFVGGVPLVRFDDAGASSTTVTPPHVDIHGACFDMTMPPSLARLLIADDGGIHRTGNNGGFWIDLNDGIGTIQMYPGISTRPVDEDFVLGGFQDNGTNRRDDDAPDAWTQRLGGDGGYTAVNPFNSITMFAEIQGTGQLWRSNNGGNSFLLANSGISSSDRNAFFSPVEYNVSVPGEVLYATHRIYRSLSGGNSWSPISGDLTSGPPYSVRALQYAPSNTTTVYAATNEGHVLVSQNGGADWELKLTDIPGWPRITKELAVDPADDATVYLSVGWFGVDQIRKSTDYGDTWTGIDGNLPDVPANCVSVHRSAGGKTIFLGTDQGVWISHTEGEFWGRLGESLPNTPVMDVRIDPTFDRIIAATLGRGAWSFALPVPADSDGDDDVDLMDYSVLLGCFSGSVDEPFFVEPSEACRELFDLDFDSDIDLIDFEGFEQRFSATN